MDKTNLLKKVKVLTLYTGTFGKKKCTCSCIGCTQESYGNRHKEYQGNLEEIKIINERLPELRDAYILGNPDVSVDTEFCNLAAKEFIKHGRKVMFSTSGYNGLEVVKKLTKDINPENINYISYSVDTVDNNKLQLLKGNKKMCIEEIDEAIKFCIDNNIKVKIQPTLWEINQDDYKQIIEHYSKMGIKWYTFHAGSFEALWDKKVIINHIKPEKWIKIVKDIEDIANEGDLKIKAPRLFLNDKEYKKYQEEKKVYCQNGGEDIQIWLQEDGIKATFCPILAEVHQEYIFDLEKEDVNLIKDKVNNCIVCSKCIDKKLRDMSINKKGKEFLIQNEILHNVCRYYSNKRKYG